MKYERKYSEALLDTLIVLSKDRKLFDEFMKDLLTPQEYKTIAMRWEIVKRLNKEQPQHEIVDDLRVGINTVTRGSRELADPNGGFQKTLKKLKS